MSSLKPTVGYNIIYVYSIPDEDHKDMLKIGKGSFYSSLSPSQLAPMCDELQTAAHKRIKEQTNTAQVTYQLEYVELAAKQVVLEDGTSLYVPFDDHDVHDVLKNSHFSCKFFTDSGKPTEWFYVDLDTAKRAIAAAKDGHKVLPPKNASGSSAVDISVPPQPKIVLREEQAACVAKTIEIFKTYDDMLWDCKMRFGKTVTAYEFIRQELPKYKKTIVITHRPAVEDGWDSDHDLIFGKNAGHLFIDKTKDRNFDCDDSLDSANDAVIDDLVAQNIPFTYFASIQDLRGSKRVGGKFNKNNRVYDLHWDLVIIDEAHEGTATELGDSVISTLLKKGTKCLRLSGTPYNFVQAYEENKYTWSYVDEQRAKHEWDEKHPGEKNPYETLPTMNILTFDLAKALADSYLYETEEIAFSFSEFFRVWTGDQKQDYRKMPEGAKVGDFVHEKDVKAFLDMISTDDHQNNYPFSTFEYRDYFRHTFWLLPGVKAARALSAMLKKHPVFAHYAIANVAGDGDEEVVYDKALELVRDTIANNDFTITLSCGKLTTGVTVKEWTGAMMLSGSSKTSAAGYMQAIFRVQSPGKVNGRQKENVYVFDFAPDRTINVISEVHAIKSSGKGAGGGDEVRAALGEFLNFCPVIAMDGTEMRYYDVKEMMRQIKRISIDAAVNSGFDDDSVFDHTAGIVFREGDADIIKKLGDVLVPQKKGKKQKDVIINDQGLTEEQRQKAEGLSRGKGKGKDKKALTPEEKDLLDKLKKQKEEQKKLFDLLRAISIRLPLLFYGAEADITEAITLENFVTIVDDESWAEFMPTGLQKPFFRELLRFFDKDVVEGAGMRIRRLAKAADELPPTKRAARVVEILSKFRNPDKETVLTPWRVVNMHLGDTVGGYNFYDETYTKELDEPRLIEQGDVTADIFLNPEAKILEMNSKSGLYPLYMAFGIYMLLIDGKEEDVPFEQAQKIWNQTLSDHIFVLCKTKMACSITIRTLAGFSGADVNAKYLPRLLERMADKPRLANKLRNPKTWNKEGEKMQFDVVVGNPPYQEEGISTRKAPIYHHFYDLAFELAPVVSIISPARFLFDAGQTPKEWNEKMLNDKHFHVKKYFPDSKDVFPTVDIKGGIAVTIRNESVEYGAIGTFTRSEYLSSIVSKVSSIADVSHRMNSIIASQGLFRFSDLFFSENPNARDYIGDGTGSKIVSSLMEKLPDLFLQEKKDESYIRMLGRIDGKRDYRFIKREYIVENNYIDCYKVFIPEANSSGKFGEILTEPVIGYPLDGSADTYLCGGKLKNISECNNFIKYFKSKFFRCLLGVKKATQHCPPAVWATIPLQDFSDKSEIDWSKSISEIDNQLYSKYGFSDEEISFVETSVQPME